MGWHDLDGAAFIGDAPDVSLALEIGEVLVHRRQGLELEALRDFFEAGGVAPVGDVLADVIEDFALASCKRHDESPERKPKRNVPEYCPNASVTASRLDAILADARARVER